MSSSLIKTLGSACVLVLGSLPVLALGEETKSVAWHFPVSLTYGSGLNKIVDATFERLPVDFGDTKFKFPFGISFQPYAQFAEGLGVGLDIGPFAFVAVEVIGGGDDDYKYGFLAPLGLFARYDFGQVGSVAPFVRAGVRQCFTTGDLLSKGSAGFYGSVGVEFSRKRKVRFGAEIGIDTSKVQVNQYEQFAYTVGLGSHHKDIKPFEFFASINVSF